jgi:dihydrolipoamide dehydrogenase
MERFDLIVVGGGPGGYVAAIRAAQLGMRVACVEKDPTLGGTCLNVGCIPSKALLHSSELFEHTAHGLAEHGVQVSGVTLDLAAMMKRKDKVVTMLTRGVAGLLKKNAVTWVPGTARLLGAGKMQVSGGDGTGRTLEATRILLATGSAPIQLPGLPFDGVRIVDSTGALALPRVPEHLVVVGAGAIGLELGSVWRRLGAKVTVVELTPGVTPGMDVEMAKLLQRALGRQGLVFRFESKVEAAVVEGETVRVTVAAKDGTREDLRADVLLVAVGRRAYADGLGLDAAGVALDERGRIPVDAQFQTAAAGVYAIGDVIRGPMLAHKASDEGVACVEMMAGVAGHVNYDAIPAVVYTAPEFAAVGATEEACKAGGVAIQIGRFPFQANARAKTMADTEGAVKIIADAASDRVLGIHIVGPHASDLIAEAAVAMEFAAASEDIARSAHAHPTLAEALKQAALGVAGRTIEA